MGKFLIAVSTALLFSIGSLFAYVAPASAGGATWGSSYGKNTNGSYSKGKDFKHKKSFLKHGKKSKKKINMSGNSYGKKKHKKNNGISKGKGWIYGKGVGNGYLNGNYNGCCKPDGKHFSKKSKKKISLHKKHKKSNKKNAICKPSKHDSKKKFSKSKKHKKGNASYNKYKKHHLKKSFKKHGKRPVPTVG
ncbi:MAG: hypothetical protein H3C68_03230 [Deltaproteobacteria bacterium]|nr:hypothetical protein [Deltaproteobacteria bacterium]MBZ0219740.1 hypothetical protein [Deltaproteobacteria bacterium]